MLRHCLLPWKHFLGRRRATDHWRCCSTGPRVDSTQWRSGRHRGESRPDSSFRTSWRRWRCGWTIWEGAVGAAGTESAASALLAAEEEGETPSDAAARGDGVQIPLPGGRHAATKRCARCGMCRILRWRSLSFHRGGRRRQARIAFLDLVATLESKQKLCHFFQR